MRSRLPRPRRGWVVLLVVLVLLIGIIRLGDVMFAIDQYHVIDEYAIAVETVSGPLTWTRVTSVSEAPTSVTIGVSELSAPLPGYGGERYWLAVNLRDPIAGRTVIDAKTGQPVRRCDDSVSCN